jgi:hypothetical protein
VHDHGFNAHLAAGALNTERDFTTVGDKDFFKHDLTLLWQWLLL